MSEATVSLVADIGGTFARFALVPGGTTEPTAIRIVRVADYDTPEAAVQDYLADKNAASLSSACLAVAGPIQSNTVKLTNTAWNIDGDGLAQRFGWTACSVINDFQAAALGVPNVAAEHLLPVARSGGGGREGFESGRQPALVLGPGTGLGLALLTPTAAGWRAEPSEAGHITFGAISAGEWSVLELLQREFGRVSVERLLSGPGLVNLYQAHATLQNQATDLQTPEQIAGAAMRNDDPAAREALDHFLSVLGRMTGDALLIHGSAREVFLCGGMLPHMADELNAGGFWEAMVDKGRMRSRVESTPVRLVTDPLLGLKGAAYYLGRE